MKNFLLLIIITSIISFLFQGKRGLWEPDEGRYAECAREMIITNDYLIPKLNLKPHLTKPPITYWAIAFSIKLFGKNEFAVRLPNSIAFFLTVILIFLIGKKLYGYEKGIYSAVIYATSIFPFIGLNIVTTDTILTFFIWLYIFFYFSKNYYLMAISMGLAFLTKGPPALLPFLGIIVYHLFNERKTLNLKVISIAVLLFLIVGLSWYIIVILKEPFAFNYFIKNEVIGRIKGIHHRNSGTFDWLMYIPIILFGLAPWILFCWKNILFKKLKIFYFIIAIPLIIFCIVKSRLPLYVLPLMPAIAIIIGVSCNIEDNKKFFKIAIISGIFLIILRIIAVYFPYSKNDKQIYNDLKKIITAKNFKLNFITTRVWNGLNFYFEKIPEYLYFKNKKLNRFSEKTVSEKINEILKKKEKNFILVSNSKKIVAFDRFLINKKIKFKKFKTKRFMVYEFN